MPGGFAGRRYPAYLLLMDKTGSKKSPTKNKTKAPAKENCAGVGQ
jgi:hypothetical protein